MVLVSSEKSVPWAAAASGAKPKPTPARGQGGAVAPCLVRPLASEDGSLMPTNGEQFGAKVAVYGTIGLAIVFFGLILMANVARAATLHAQHTSPTSKLNLFSLDVRFSTEDAAEDIMDEYEEVDSIKLKLYHNGAGSCTITNIDANLSDSTGLLATEYHLTGEAFTAYETKVVTFDFSDSTVAFYPTADEWLEFQFDNVSGTCNPQVYYSTTNTYGCGGDIVNCHWGSTSSRDVWFQLYTDNTSPTLDPTVTVVDPVGSHGTDAPLLKLYTDVLKADFPSEDPDFEVKVEYYDDVSAVWTTQETQEYTWSDYGFYYNGGSGLAYALGSIPDMLLPGNYLEHDTWRLSARADFGSGFGDWSAVSSFDTGVLPYGGGGGGSWGPGDGGFDEWDDFFGDSSTAYPPPTCQIFSFTWDSGTDGDGMTCVWSWTKWLVVPPSDAFFNFVSQPLRMLSTRWPFHYITTVVTEVQVGWSQAESCPLPTYAGGTFMGSAVPEIDACDWFDQLEATVEANSTVENILVTVIWFGVALGSVFMAKRFLLS